jgi:hypothetical protein
VIYFEATYGPRAWHRLSPDIETIKMQGNHAEVVRDPANLARIANHLRTKAQAGR